MQTVHFRYGVWEHAVAVLGDRGDTFYIHDPASTRNSAIGYNTRTLEK